MLPTAKLLHELQVAEGIVVVNGNIAGSLVGNMHFVALFHQPEEGTAHADDVIVGVGTKNDDPLARRLGALRTRTVIGIGLASRPASNGVL